MMMMMMMFIVHLIQPDHPQAASPAGTLREDAELQTIRLLLGDKILVSGGRRGKLLLKKPIQDPVIEEPCYLCIYYVFIAHTVYSVS